MPGFVNPSTVFTYTTNTQEGEIVIIFSVIGEPSFFLFFKS